MIYSNKTKKTQNENEYSLQKTPQKKLKTNAQQDKPPTFYGNFIQTYEIPAQNKNQFQQEIKIFKTQAKEILYESLREKIQEYRRQQQRIEEEFQQIKKQSEQQEIEVNEILRIQQDKNQLQQVHQNGQIENSHNNQTSKNENTMIFPQNNSKQTQITVKQDEIKQFFSIRQGENQDVNKGQTLNLNPTNQNEFRLFTQVNQPSKQLFNQQGSEQGITSNLIGISLQNELKQQVPNQKQPSVSGIFQFNNQEIQVDKQKSNQANLIVSNELNSQISNQDQPFVSEIFQLSSEKFQTEQQSSKQGSLNVQNELNSQITKEIQPLFSGIFNHQNPLTIQSSQQREQNNKIAGLNQNTQALQSSQQSEQKNIFSGLSIQNEQKQLNSKESQSSFTGIFQLNIQKNLQENKIEKVTEQKSQTPIEQQSIFSGLFQFSNPNLSLNNQSSDQKGVTAEIGNSLGFLQNQPQTQQLGKSNGFFFG